MINPFVDGDVLKVYFKMPDIFLLFFRYYQQFPINRKTGESNLTQIYTEVWEAKKSNL